MRAKLLQSIQAIINMTHLFQTVGALKLAPADSREISAFDEDVNTSLARANFEKDIVKMMNSFATKLKSYKQKKSEEEIAYLNIERQ